MKVFLLSNRCGHCVQYGGFANQQRLDEALARLVGTDCPVCGAQVCEGDLVVAVTDTQMEAVKAGVTPWDKADSRPETFDRFFDTDAAPVTEIGGVAGRLRGRMRQKARQDQRELLTKIGDAFAAVGGVEWGLEAWEAGEYRRAAVWLGRALECLEEHEVVKRAGAALCLGLSLQELDEELKAEDAFRQAAESGPGVDTVTRSAAAHALGALLQKRGRTEQARAAFQLSLDVDDPMFSPKAAVDLGVLEDKEGHRARAKELWDYALARGDGLQREYAHFNLGWYWQQLGDRRQARKHYRRAARSQDRYLAGRARDRLSEV